PRRQLVWLVVDAPREVMDGADAPVAAAFLLRLAHVEDSAGAPAGHGIAVPLALGGDVLEAERLDEEEGRRPDVALDDARAVQPPNLVPHGHGPLFPRR